MPPSLGIQGFREEGAITIQNTACVGVCEADPLKHHLVLGADPLRPTEVFVHKGYKAATQKPMASQLLTWPQLPQQFQLGGLSSLARCCGRELKAVADVH